MQVGSHRENGKKNKRALIYRYFVTQELHGALQPLVLDSQQAASTRLPETADAHVSAPAPAPTPARSTPEAHSAGPRVTSAEASAAKNGLTKDGSAGNKKGDRVSLNLIRQLRQEIIKNRIKEDDIVLRNEIRYLWHTCAVEVRRS